MDYAVSGLYYSDISSDVLTQLDSSLTSIDYTYMMMVFPASVELSSSGGSTIGKGSFPGTKTWYKGGHVSDVGLGVHEIGTVNFTFWLFSVYQFVMNILMSIFLH